ncbi:hypothetical protein EJ06DRAFT_581139 [Trichodelitschia bisporula]|uniref:Uncharacterized protein n=1 Tax=Trichodelitschia bisporula TaxID=703511 RepID=A0A6G1I0V3_9PEZI|nr:hypothetical protein EJ06DRAFT_581139 [Trichodelitschia bisporula]
MPRNSRTNAPAPPLRASQSSLHPPIPPFPFSGPSPPATPDPPASALLPPPGDPDDAIPCSQQGAERRFRHGFVEVVDRRLVHYPSSDSLSLHFPPLGGFPPPPSRPPPPPPHQASQQRTPAPHPTSVPGLYRRMMEVQDRAMTLSRVDLEDVRAACRLVDRLVLPSVTRAHSERIQVIQYAELLMSTADRVAWLYRPGRAWQCEGFAGEVYALRRLVGSYPLGDRR